MISFFLLALPTELRALGRIATAVIGPYWTRTNDNGNGIISAFGART